MRLLSRDHYLHQFFDLIVDFSQDAADDRDDVCAKSLEHLPYLNKRNHKSRYNISAFADADVILRGMLGIYGGNTRKIRHRDQIMIDTTQEHGEGLNSRW
jgi:hypothetical protein